jgi:hypothetical protein
METGTIRVEIELPKTFYLITEVKEKDGSWSRERFLSAKIKLFGNSYDTSKGGV